MSSQTGNQRPLLASGEGGEEEHASHCGLPKHMVMKCAGICCLGGTLAAVLLYHLIFMPGLDDSTICQPDTGGSCRAFPCSTHRGNTTCSNDHKCLCQEGYCANAGRCVKKGVCVKETGGTCSLANCAWHRGPTKCHPTKKLCICEAGFCSDNGICRLYALGTPKAERTVVAQAVQVNQKQPKFPGRQGKVTSALCVSGGGMRSLTLAAGTLRALEALNLMDRIDVLSAVSGGAWASALYTFSRNTTEELLGPATDPTKLTLDALKNSEYIMQEVASKSLSHFMSAWALHEPDNPNDLWNQYVATTVLWPAGLRGPEWHTDAQYSFIAASEQHKQEIISKNPRMSWYRYLWPARKQLLVVSATLLAPVDSETGGGKAVSLQMSPDFTGSPFYADNAKIDYTKLDGKGSHSQWVGGGMEETFAFDNKQPHDMSAVGTTLDDVHLPEPAVPFSLMRMLGATSDAMAGALSNHVGLKGLVPSAVDWPYGHNGTAETFKLGDGGNLENSGVLAMLQRKVKRIIWLINTDTGIAPKRQFDWCKSNKTTDSDQIRGAITNQVYDKFGYGLDDTGTGMLSHNQVFPVEDLFTVACDAQKKRDRGEPALVKKTQTVQANAFWGIEGGWSIDMLYVFNDRVQQFVDKLPSETTNNIALKATGNFANYPFLKTVRQKSTELTAYEPEQVNLLAAQAEYVVKSQQSVFTSFLSD